MTFVASGPEALSYGDAARSIGEAIGKEVIYEDADPQAFREVLIAEGGLPQWRAEELAFIASAYGGGVGETVSDTVARVGGSEPRSFAEFAKEHAEHFAGGLRTTCRTKVGEVLAQVRQKALDAYSNQDVPFELLVERLNPVRSTAHHPLFQVAMAFQNNVRPQVGLDGVSIEAVAVGTGTAKFDLDIQLTETATEDPGAPRCAGVVSYATDLYDRATIERLVGGSDG